MKLDEVLHRIFWGLMSGVAIYAATQMREMQVSISELNTKMSIYIERSEGLRKVVEDHEHRLRILEKK
jgi:cell division protein FtsL